MAQNKTNYGRKHVLDHMLHRVQHTYGEVYATLLSSDATVAGLLTGELTQSGFARVALSALLSDAVLASGQTTNSADITFGPAGEDWPEIVCIGIMDVATLGAGNMLYFGPPVTTR